MTFRIETALRGRSTVFLLSGRIEKPATVELKKLFERQADCEIVLDLKDVGVVDRNVMKLLVRCGGVRPETRRGVALQEEESRPVIHAGRYAQRLLRSLSPLHVGSPSAAFGDGGLFSHGS